MKTISGRLSSKRPALGRLTLQRLPLRKRGETILITDQPRWSDAGYAGLINTVPHTSSILPPQLTVGSIAEFQEGDVVLFEDNKAHFLWETNNQNNGLLLTEACNCRCLMCPQPPKTYDKKQPLMARRVLALSPEGFEGEICLTGGEPTLCGDALFELLTGCHRRHPKAGIIMLTNGKRFSDFSFAKRFAALGVPLTLAVSLHADVDTLHDRIVNTNGSFQMTQQGLYNLAKLGQRIEIRVVVSRLNSDRLPQISRHIYRNYPFASHIAFMGLEVTGHAVQNYDTVWVDPLDYGSILGDALHELHRAGMCVSAYNHPLCLLPRSAWWFARKSISDWKNAYSPVCDQCKVREKCCGVFTTSGNHLSSGIRPVKE
jgi:His-Xaa-Ser system radical SAM maturase HxsC